MENNNYFARDRNEMLNFLPKSFRNVIEIGCGQGEFGKLVKSIYEINYTGIESNVNAAKIANNYIDRVIIGDATKLIKILPDHNYDLLICNDIIEHLESPENLIKEIRVKMKPDSWIVCSIPNFRVLGNLLHVLFLKDFEYCEWGIRDKTHLRFYTRKSIIRFFRENGCNVEIIKGINPIKTVMTSIPLGLLQIMGHGDIRFHQFGVTAKFLS